jgi:hypothetical protein
MQAVLKIKLTIVSEIRSTSVLMVLDSPAGAFTGLSVFDFLKHNTPVSNCCLWFSNSCPTLSSSKTTPVADRLAHSSLQLLNN